MKKILYIVFATFLMNSVNGLEKTKQEKVAKFVLENIQKDYKSCYAFYKIAAESFKKTKADKAIVKGLNESADITLKFTHDLGEVLALKPKMMTEDKSELIIRMEGPTFMTLKRSLKVTFADKLGSIGGTLGLFSGFSLLAIMELIHWICKIINSLMVSKK